MPTDAVEAGPPHVLLAEDDEPMREYMAAMLGLLGYRVTTAANGLEALETLRRSAINLVVTDWMMPVMDGAELCRAVRASGFERYTYIILLTGRQDSTALVEGMEAGADDYLTKPPDVNELRVRLKAGERVLRLEHRLASQNAGLIAANNRIREAHERIEADLEAAALIQRRLLPSPADLAGLRYDWLFAPSSHVGGDTFNVLRAGPETLAFFQIDVAGHGVPAALLSFTLQRLLSVDALQVGGHAVDDPALVVAELNRRFQAEIDATYFTMIFGLVDERSGRVSLTQAGHPSPIHARRADGTAALVGDGGPVVGLFSEVEFETVGLRLTPGDRLFLYTDGISECAAPDGAMFSEERLLQLAADSLAWPLERAMTEIDQALNEWRGESAYDDDVSLLVIEKTDWSVRP